MLNAAAVIGAASACALGTAALAPADAVRDGPVLCPLRGATGLPCPLCGATRATVLALHGDPGWTEFNWWWPPLLVAALLLSAAALTSPSAARAIGVAVSRAFATRARAMATLLVVAVPGWAIALSGGGG